MNKLVRLIASLSVLAVGCSATASTTTTMAPATATTVASTTTTTTVPASTTTTYPQAAIDIRTALNSYLAAIEAKDGASAVQFVDEGTLDLFDDLLLLAVTEVHVDEMEFVDAILVVRLRHRFEADQLSAMTARDLFVTAIEEDLLISTPGEEIAFESINIIDDEGTGVVSGSPVMWFALESTGWKVAIGRTFEEFAPVLSVQMEQFARDAAGPDASRADAILVLLATVEEAEVDPALLAGPRG